MTESSSATPSSATSFSFQGLLGATVTVLLTTLDDSVWLVRFVGSGISNSSSNNNQKQQHNKISVNARIVNALTFLSTLVILAVICCVVAIVIIETTTSATATETAARRTSNDGEEESQEQELLEIRLQLIAAILCWSLAIGFYIKKQLQKRRRRRRRNMRDTREKEQSTVGSTGGGEGPDSNSSKDDVPKTTTTTKKTTTTYDSILPAQEEEEEEEEGKQDDNNGMIMSASGTSMSTSTGVKDTDEGSSLIGNDGGENDSPTSSPSSSPWTVISLTFLGFLDEISYFPTLIVGNIFTSSELVAGTFLAGIVMLTIQIFLATAAKPFVDWFDRHIKLYHIIGIFATILTIQLLFDVLLPS